jgi:hypothetical protein
MEKRIQPEWDNCAILLKLGEIVFHQCGFVFCAVPQLFPFVEIEDMLSIIMDGRIDCGYILFFQILERCDGTSF